MRVKIWLHKLSQPIDREVSATYQKGDLFCIEWGAGDDRMVQKYPIGDIFRIQETYN